MADIHKEKKFKRERRHTRVRAKVSGSSTMPRLNVYKSNTGVFVQLIDDLAGKTLASASNKELKSKKGDNKTQQSLEVGKLIAQKAKKLKLERVVFDKGGFKYHGRVKAVADGAREEGLKF